ncbi:MAG TPA: hypothetical protein VH062_20805 [Polyangiaceae bacterium]|jgi:hypothetical protein|nr:hypothetical protein [Polyangiaceae bacterium]
MSAKVSVSGNPVSRRTLDPELQNTAAIRVGRLLEVRAAHGYRSREDVDLLFNQLEQEVARLAPGVRYVTVVDWRLCPVMSPDAAKRIVERMANLNARTERSATIAANDSPTAVLQFVRVIRDSGHPDRKLFFEKDELFGWLAELLDPPETERLRQFLDE